MQEKRRGDYGQSPVRGQETLAQREETFGRSLVRGRGTFAQRGRNIADGLEPLREFIHSMKPVGF